MQENFDVYTLLGTAVTILTLVLDSFCVDRSNLLKVCARTDPDLPNFGNILVKC